MAIAVAIKRGERKSSAIPEKNISKILFHEGRRKAFKFCVWSCSAAIFCSFLRVRKVDRSFSTSLLVSYLIVLLTPAFKYSVASSLVMESITSTI